jgi:hypothetical protein
MNIFYVSLGLFVIGLVEYTIDQYQKLLLSRLKFWSTVAFQLVNKLFECVINLYIFGTIVVFWEKFINGNHDFKLLLPYLLYTFGTVAGTGVAMIIYTSNKKKKDHDKAVKYLENKIKKKTKKGHKKKKVEDLQHNPNTMLDPVEVEDVKNEIKERAIETATQKISERIDEAFNNEESK